MKNVCIAITVMMSIALFYACKKQDTYVRHSPNEMAAKLYLNESFIQFSGQFIGDFFQFTNYLREPARQSNRKAFLTAFQQAADNETSLDDHLRQYGLSLDEWLIRKNKIDNDLLQLFLQLPELRTYTDEEIMQIIKSGIQLGMTSEDRRWEQIRQQSVNIRGVGRIASMSVGGDTNVPMVLDGYEVWDCLKDAVGLGAATVLGIAGLKKLAGQGVQSIVISLSRFLAKYAGWIGLGVMVLDFSACLYHEYQD
ncbi:MAG: hypothetical protein ACKOOA_10955 [Sediminibacterium sp.]